MTAGHGYDYSVPTHIPLDVVAGTGSIWLPGISMARMR